MYMRASELRNVWHFYIIKVLFLSIWMGRNNHLQIILFNVCMIFVGGGGAPGGTENLCGGGGGARAPQAPPP